MASEAGEDSVQAHGEIHVLPTIELDGIFKKLSSWLTKSQPNVLKKINITQMGMKTEFVYFIFNWYSNSFHSHLRIIL